MRITRWYVRCCTVRVTFTTIVFCIAALETTPINSCRAPRWLCGALAGASLGICRPLLRARGLFRAAARALLQIHLAHDCFHAGEVLLRLAHLLDALRLTGRQLEPQPENLVAELALLDLQLVAVHLPEFLDSMGHHNSPVRVTNLVRIGSFCAAKSIASVAEARSIPDISNIISPGLTTATQRSGGPLPLPMRVSAGFLVNGLSGNTRIQSFPPRLMKRVIATRAASICRSVIHAGSSAFKPYSPNASAEPRHALPLRRPRCCFRYFTFFGINMIQCPWPLAISFP